MYWTIASAVIIGVIYPIYLLLTARKTFSRIRIGEISPLEDYKITAYILWTLTFIVLANYILNHQPQLNFYPTTNIVGIVLIILIAIIAFIQFKNTKVTQENADVMHQKFESILFYLPASKKQFNWFIFLSFTAGICEEIIFRLFLFHFFIEHVGLIIAFLLTNLLFAFTHIGSGKKNIINTFVLGLVFTVIYYYSENIWLAVILHTVIDLHAGITGYNIKKYFANKSIAPD